MLLIPEEAATNALLGSRRPEEGAGKQRTLHTCVLILLRCMCPHTAIYTCPHTAATRRLQNGAGKQRTLHTRAPSRA
jgi:hypothetical protein